MLTQEGNDGRLSAYIGIRFSIVVVEKLPSSLHGRRVARGSIGVVENKFATAKDGF